MERVRDMLSRVSGVKEKRMFGSIAFMVRGKMCVTARAERIMCRIDPALHDAAVGRSGCQAVVMRGRQYRGYVYVASEALRTNRELRYWIHLALDYNEASAQKAASLASRVSRTLKSAKRSLDSRGEANEQSRLFSLRTMKPEIRDARRHLMAPKAKPPNKALEPTSTSVTPRALSGASEMKHRTEKPSKARVAPAVAVAHL